MSSIRLEWNIESQRIDRANGEDPLARRARRRTLLRFSILIAALLVLLAAIGALVQKRLLDVQAQMEQLLRDTVSAEVAALRIGDVFTYLNLQYGDNLEWRREQQATFRHYSDLKTRGNLILTGTVLDLEIDGQRARATVEEYVNGLPFAQVWFYLREEDGWYHAPTDYGFWGEARKTEAGATVVTYRAADQLFAEAISESIGRWWQQGCELLRCENLPDFRVSIVTDIAQDFVWTDDSRLHLQVLSPYVGRARADLPFTFTLQQRIAETLAERLVDLQTHDLRVTYPHDVVYLRQSVIRFLADQFRGVYSGTTLLHSLVDAYGADALAKLVSLFAADSNMSILRQALAESTEDAQIDWRDFVKWRLNVEAELLVQRDQRGWLSMYDTANESVQGLLYERFHDSQPSRVLDVVDQLIWQSPNSSPQLRATARVEVDTSVEQQVILFNLIDDVWKRAS